MNIIYKIIIIAIITAFLSALFKRSHPEYSVALTITASLIIFYFISDSLAKVYETVKMMMSDTNIEIGYITNVLKIIGIAYLSEYSCAMLEDAGETAIAKKVEMAGKVIIFLITVPILKSLLDLIISLI